MLPNSNDEVRGELGHLTVVGSGQSVSQLTGQEENEPVVDDVYPEELIRDGEGGES